LYNPKTTRGDPHLHSYESYPSGDKEEVKNWKIARTLSSQKGAHLLVLDLEDLPPSCPRCRGTRNPGGQKERGRRHICGTRLTNKTEKTQWIKQMGHMEDKWQVVHPFTGSDFHQLLNIHKDTQDDCWGFKIKEWWRGGDIRVKKPKKRHSLWPITTSCSWWKDVFMVDLWGHETPARGPRGQTRSFCNFNFGSTELEHPSTTRTCGSHRMSE
jgi:hypothetical protein